MNDYARESISRTVNGIDSFLQFWINCEGWAPPVAAEYLSKQKAAWFRSELHMLYVFSEIPKPERTSGNQILGYVCLRSLCEYLLKVLFCAYKADYETGSPFNKNGNIVQPPELSFEQLKQLWAEHGEKELLPFLNRVQLRGNAIHSFKNRDIGKFPQLLDDIVEFEQFFLSINSQLPYPD